VSGHPPRAAGRRTRAKALLGALRNDTGITRWLRSRQDDAVGGAAWLLITVPLSVATFVIEASQGIGSSGERVWLEIGETRRAPPAASDEPPRDQLTAAQPGQTMTPQRSQLRAGDARAARSGRRDCHGGSTSSTDDNAAAAQSDPVGGKFRIAVRTQSWEDRCVPAAQAAFRPGGSPAHCAEPGGDRLHPTIRKPSGVDTGDQVSADETSARNRSPGQPAARREYGVKS